MISSFYVWVVSVARAFWRLNMGEHTPDASYYYVSINDMTWEHPLHFFPFLMHVKLAGRALNSVLCLSWLIVYSSLCICLTECYILHWSEGQMFVWIDSEMPARREACISIVYGSTERRHYRSVCSWTSTGLAARLAQEQYGLGNSVIGTHSRRKSSIVRFTSQWDPKGKSIYIYSIVRNHSPYRPERWLMRPF